MGNSWFQFQQFRVEQAHSAMKISTDAILLGALAEQERPQKILDIGTGTGVIALMLAQRFENAEIVGIELDESAALEASSNFLNSPFSSRLHLQKGAVQEMSRTEQFDLIVSNPPFFPDHLKSSDPKRNRALHTDHLSFEELAIAVEQLLKPQGVFWVILPPRQILELVQELEKFDLFPVRSIEIQDNPNKPIHRVLKAFEKKKKSMVSHKFQLKDSSGTYTDFYRSLASGFLLDYP